MPSPQLETFPEIVTGDNEREKAKSTPERPRSKSYSGGGQRKGSSGNILSKFPLFRAPETPPSPSGDDIVPFPEAPDLEDEKQQRNPILSNVIETQNKTRKRKGSLRKTALLGTGKLRLDRRSSNADGYKSKSPTKLQGWVSSKFSSATNPLPLTKTKPSSAVFELPTSPSSSEGISAAQESLRLDTQQARQPSLLSPLTSPTGPYTSTTDEDESPVLQNSLASLVLTPSKGTSSIPSPPSSESSINVPTTSQRHRSSKANPKSPLAAPHVIQSSVSPVDEWDYSATEWWGWIILTVTWIVFVVGMGSCLEVWSWAWDVGETPYAPPELEDDETLPIVGYYPAIMVLTVVMAWVWVFVAWLGMKYFKHAKFQGEET